MNDRNPSDFIKQHQYGVLSTHSVAEQGYPFGSLTPYIISEQGELAIYISDLAEHTQNIKANAKVSLTISDAGTTENIMESTRITCLAMAEKADIQTHLRHKYLQQFPQSEMVLQLPGFNFYLLKLTKVRLILGFGKAKWLDADKLTLLQDS